MIRIGLIGEAPNDTDCMKVHLLKKYNESVEFFPLLNRINGSQLDNQKTKRMLRVEFELEQPDLVVFIRDLDGLMTDKEQLEKRKSYFTDFKTVVNKNALYLLHVFEIEALILSNIDVFNALYGTDAKDIGDPMLISEPKEVLRALNNKYNESQNTSIFEKLDFDQTLSCAYFSRFIKDLDRKLLEF